MSTMKRMLVCLATLSATLLAQNVYEIPFASKGNEIELTIENKSDGGLTDVSVVTEAPSWVRFRNASERISEMADKSEQTVHFDFDIDKAAPVNESTKLLFEIEGEGGVWYKEINIKVLPPEEFKLEQNYPNPFNPTTTIEYLLPTKAKVDIRIYNLLGQQVEQVINKIQEPGLRKVNWNAEAMASGMYIYQVYFEGKDLSAKAVRKKMIVLK